MNYTVWHNDPRCLATTAIQRRSTVWPLILTFKTAVTPLHGLVQLVPFTTSCFVPTAAGSWTKPTSMSLTWRTSPWCSSSTLASCWSWPIASAAWRKPHPGQGGAAAAPPLWSASPAFLAPRGVSPSWAQDTSTTQSCICSAFSTQHKVFSLPSFSWTAFFFFFFSEVFLYLALCVCVCVCVCTLLYRCLHLCLDSLHSQEGEKDSHGEQDPFIAISVEPQLKSQPELHSQQNTLFHTF